MLFSLSMFPLGASRSVRRPVAEVIDEIDRAGLPYEVTGMDTVMEGEWDEVLPVVRRAESRLRDEYGRVFMMLTMDDNAGVKGRLAGAVTEVERELGRVVPH